MTEVVVISGTLALATTFCQFLHNHDTRVARNEMTYPCSDPPPDDTIELGSGGKEMARSS